DFDVALGIDDGGDPSGADQVGRMGQTVQIKLFELHRGASLVMGKLTTLALSDRTNLRTHSAALATLRQFVNPPVEFTRLYPVSPPAALAAAPFPSRSCGPTGPRAAPAGASCRSRRAR